MQFSLLSHFYAYLMEALVDLNEIDMAKQAMHNIERYQKESGAIPALNNVDWVCSTGLFQLALVWFRLGEIDRGNKAFEYACKLQNESGGWYGSYLSEENIEENNFYFPTGEISWACKYFLDALYYKNLADFNDQSELFLDFIAKSDGRYKILKDIVGTLGVEAKILDAGCGKGRYLKNLIEDYSDKKYYAVDLAKRVMEHIDDDRIMCKQGSLTCLPYNDNEFDCLFTCEALEHAVDIDSAIREMVRVVKSSGKIVIIDKNIERLGQMEIGQWEQWFDEKELNGKLRKYCSKTTVFKDIKYENLEANGLFLVWVGTVADKIQV